MKFSDNLRQLREKHGYTQKEMAELINVDRSAYAKYENYGMLPNLFVGVKLARLLGVTAEELLGIYDEEEEQEENE